MSAGCRMIIMHTVNFLYVLYLTDVYGLNAMTLGAFSTVFAIAILATTRLGGQLADRIHYRWIVGSSFAIQCGALTGLALLSPPLLGAAGLILAQALGGGLAPGRAASCGDGGDPGDGKRRGGGDCTVRRALAAG